MGKLKVFWIGSLTTFLLASLDQNIQDNTKIKRLTKENHTYENVISNLLGNKYEKRKPHEKDAYQLLSKRHGTDKRPHWKTI